MYENELIGGLYLELKRLQRQIPLSSILDWYLYKNDLFDPSIVHATVETDFWGFGEVLMNKQNFFFIFATGRGELGAMRCLINLGSHYLRI